MWNQVWIEQKVISVTKIACFVVAWLLDYSSFSSRVKSKVLIIHATQQRFSHFYWVCFDTDSSYTANLHQSSWETFPYNYLTVWQPMWYSNLTGERWMEFVSIQCDQYRVTFVWIIFGKTLTSKFSDVA